MARDHLIPKTDTQQFEVIRPKYVGLDVHKKSVVSAVCTSDPVTLTASYKTSVFNTTTSDIATLRDWLLTQDCHDVCMESTSKYWIPIFNILEPHMHVILTHPKYVKAIKGKKTDKRDAKWIANLFRFDIVKASFIPPADIRALRELSRYRLKLSYMRTAEKNRYQNSMTISRIRIDCVLTDPFGLSATRIMDYLLSDEPFDEEKCRSLIDWRVKASKDDVLDSIRGYNIPEEQKFKMTHAKAHMDFINKSIDEIEAELFLRSRQYDTQVKRIATVTGITGLSALFILSEIGADMSVFESDRHLCSWAGLTPANNESANKKKSARCSRAGQYLKPLLIQCALAAVKSKKEPYFAIKYQRIAKRRGKKKAIIAIARMMLTSIYHMLSEDKDFRPDDYEATVNPPKQKPTVLTIENTLQFLREQGADPETLTLIQQQCAAQAG